MSSSPGGTGGPVLASPSTSTSVPPFTASSTWTDPFSSTSSDQGTSTTSSSSDSLGAGSGNDGGSLNSSASLYLYTFLATLILLLGVSAAIVFRSLILRRRHRRMVNEAILNGTWIPPASRRGMRFDPSQKPIMYEAAMNIEKNHHDWEACKPFSVSYTVAASKRTPPLVPPPLQQDNSARARFHRIWSHVDASPLPPPLASPALDAPLLPDPSGGPLRLSVLVAMPSQHHQEGLPHLEFGTTDIPVAYPAGEDDASPNAGNNTKSINSSAEDNV
ncbi:uncharacterized protein BT62DRAFT_995821 [Guyanagaster necrorhizus]|uniref:Uncharacterized protein n=1 Tax=Guyanagaster necrorhizus TaxID=856835 RepID=A0A9P7VPT4_9AGAR|nr:uncharacterized protein BT62DRAFT_995821 [Guyanagaster necrorhizus MCA 3950]KAG7443789.1 hypothetical protein BT62DRAFT_995821 [Guyanagaster necrorhizus MCA 3950]